MFWLLASEFKRFAQLFFCKPYRLRSFVGRTANPQNDGVVAAWKTFVRFFDYSRINGVGDQIVLSGDADVSFRAPRGRIVPSPAN